MKAFSRREIVFWGMNGCCLLSAGAAQANQPAKAPVTGRIIFLPPQPANQLPGVLCYLIGAANATIIGQFDRTSGEFSFPSIPPGTFLKLRIQFNGQSFNYAALDTKAPSRLEICLHAIRVSGQKLGDKIDAKTLMDRTGVVSLERLRGELLSAINAIGQFALECKADEKLRGAYFEVGGFQETGVTLDSLNQAAQEVISAAGDPKAEKIENKLLMNSYPLVREIWRSLG